MTPTLRVTTENGSVYLIDLDRDTVTRTIVGHASTDLRRDGEEVRFIRIPYPPTIGRSFTMVLDLREDGSETIRTTSHVVDVTLISDTPGVIDRELLNKVNW